MDTIIELQKTRELHRAADQPRPRHRARGDRARAWSCTRAAIVEDAPPGRSCERPQARVHADAAQPLRRPARRGRGAARLRRPARSATGRGCGARPRRPPHTPTVVARARRRTDQHADRRRRRVEDLPGPAPRREPGARRRRRVVHARARRSRSPSSGPSARASRPSPSSSPAVEQPDQRQHPLRRPRRRQRCAARHCRRLHRDVQMVFQDPYSALNPLHTVEYTLTRPVVNYTGLRGRDARRRVLELLETVGLTPGRAVRGEAAAPALRRPAPARGDRPGARQRPAGDHRRRARLDARRVAARRRARAARGPARTVGRDACSTSPTTCSRARRGHRPHHGAQRGRGGRARATPPTCCSNPQDDYTIRLLDAIPNPAARSSRDRGAVRRPGPAPRRVEHFTVDTAAGPLTAFRVRPAGPASRAWPCSCPASPAPRRTSGCCCR